MPLVFRVERPGSDQGLWYTTKGELNPQVHKLGLACATLPMDFDPAVYQADGVAWYSGCSKLEELYQWFSPKEMLQMRDSGFKLVMFNTELVRPHYGHVIFSKAHLKGQQEIDLTLIA